MSHTELSGASYPVRISRSAQKTLENQGQIGEELKTQIKIIAHHENPTDVPSKKSDVISMGGNENMYRIRHRGFRAIFELQKPRNGQDMLLIHKVEKRDENTYKGSLRR